jgi:hypothetical protein
MSVPTTTMELVNRLPHEAITIGPTTVTAVKNLAVLIDTHRDHPHVGSFHSDIHRGECRPMTVHTYIGIGRDGQAIPMLVNAETGQTMMHHPKHLFVSLEWYENWFVNWIMEHGTSPVDDEGKMATSHFRDPGAKVYLLKTYGYMVRERARKDRIGY